VKNTNQINNPSGGLEKSRPPDFFMFDIIPDRFPKSSKKGHAKFAGAGVSRRKQDFLQVS
jgi:hypothetical protein